MCWIDCVLEKENTAKSFSYFNFSKSTKQTQCLKFSLILKFDNCLWFSASKWFGFFSECMLFLDTASTTHPIIQIDYEQSRVLLLNSTI